MLTSIYTKLNSVWGFSFTFAKTGFSWFGGLSVISSIKGFINSYYIKPGTWMTSLFYTVIGSFSAFIVMPPLAALAFTVEFFFGFSATATFIMWVARKLSLRPNLGRSNV